MTHILFFLPGFTGQQPFAISSLLFFSPVVFAPGFFRSRFTRCVKYLWKFKYFCIFVERRTVSLCVASIGSSCAQQKREEAFVQNAVRASRLANKKESYKCGLYVMRQLGKCDFFFGAQRIDYSPIYEAPYRGIFSRCLLKVGYKVPLKFFFWAENGQRNKSSLIHQSTQ